ncbi:MAG TPA: aminotransferase class I/II-fold pyridoxal phosphate-dependent enzyme [Anaerolineaceae bacterium]
MIITAKRMQHLSPHFFATLNNRVEVLQRAGKDIIRLDEGSPDLPPSPAIIAALNQSALQAGAHSYQPHRGSLALRCAWAGMYQRLHNVALDPEKEIIPLMGSKEGIFHFPLAFIDPGDVVLIPNPGYITYTRGTLMAGGEPFYLPLLESSDYLPDLQAIPASVLKRAKILWLNYPNNPTAAIAPLDFFTRAVEFARQHDLIVCHDAAYSQVSYDGYQPASILQVPGAKDVAVEFNSLSKSHNMAGWRVGALVGNAEILKAFYTLKTNADSSHFLPILTAAVEAMVGDQAWLAERNAVYQARRDVLLSGLRSLGLEPQVPKASLYVWTPTPPGWGAVEFTNRVLEEANVSLTPGVVFGEHGEGYVRISVTAPLERIRQAVERITSLNWEEK